MPIHQGRGILVAFEGIDGAGKTTQAALLAKALGEAAEPCKSSKEPTNGSWGRKIRESATSERFTPMEELKYFLRDREDHTKRIIQPALDEEAIVILDRYYHSTIAYQGVRGFKVDALQEMMRERFVIPDVVFLLDIDPQLSMPRIVRRGDGANVFENIDNLTKARAIFNSLQDEKIIKVDGGLPIQTVHNLVLTAFIKGALKDRRCAKQYGCDDPFSCSYRLSNTCSWFNSSARLQATLVAQ